MGAIRGHCALLVSVVGFAALPLDAQTLFVPGTIGSSTQTGKVGIGTSAPWTPLHVVGPITAGESSGSTNGIDYVYGQYSSGKLFVLGSQYSSGASFLGYGVRAKSGNVGYVSSTDIGVGRSAIEANVGHVSFLTGPWQTSTDGGSVEITERMRISSAGDVGIGTSAPGARLDVGGPTGAVYGTVSIKQSSSGQKGVWLQAHENNNAIAIFHTGSLGVITTDYTGTGTHVPLLLQSTGGGVGIGTSNPGAHKLAVNGSIKAREVIVETSGWADYVLAADYPLQSLLEIESHIKQHQHLPGMPSAREVVENGVSIADMQVKLLAKIEELTLHAIEQQKRHQDMERRIIMLENENSTLRREISAR